jgi:putative phosphoesterase
VTRVGILSDTHNEHSAIRAAVKLFEKQGCTWIVHLGDFYCKDALRCLEPRNSNLRFAWVYGNEDEKHFQSFDTMLAVSKEVRGALLSTRQSPEGRCEIDGVRFGLCHLPFSNGLNTGPIADWCNSTDVRFALYGHFHRFNLRFATSTCSTVLLNPGSFFKEPWTLCILDLETNAVELYVYVDSGFGKVTSITLNTRMCKPAEYFDHYAGEVRKLLPSEPLPLQEGEVRPRLKAKFRDEEEHYRQGKGNWQIGNASEPPSSWIRLMDLLDGKQSV